MPAARAGKLDQVFGNARSERENGICTSDPPGIPGNEVYQSTKEVLSTSSLFAQIPNPLKQQENLSEAAAGLRPKGGCLQLVALPVSSTSCFANRRL
jgi:hypothetical protein